MSREPRALEAVPDSDDQVARLQRMGAQRPHAQAWHHEPFWYGAHPVGRRPWTTGPRNELRDVLDVLDQFAAMDDELAAIEAARPGWLAYLSPLRTWHAWRGPLRADGTSAIDLDAQIAHVERIEATWPGWTMWRRGDEWGASHPGGLFPGGTVDGPDLDHIESRIADTERAWMHQRRRLRQLEGKAWRGGGA